MKRYVLSILFVFTTSLLAPSIASAMNASSLLEMHSPGDPGKKKRLRGGHRERAGSAPKDRTRDSGTFGGRNCHRTHDQVRRNAERLGKRRR